jgi:hypothetical protein
MIRVALRSTVMASSLACFVALGCGGSTPPAAAPEAAHPATDAPKPAATAPATPESTSTPPAEASASPAGAAAPPASSTPEPQKPEEPVVTRTLSDRVFAPRVAYMVNYPASGAKDVADKKCAAKSPEPEAKAACMDKEREKFTADVLVFKKADGESSLTIYKRAGNALSEMSKSKVVLGEDTPEKLAVKVESDKGWRSLFSGKKAFEVRFRDEYSIELDDPQFGALVYEARIGMLD